MIQLNTATYIKMTCLCRKKEKDWSLRETWSVNDSCRSKAGVSLRLIFNTYNTTAACSNRSSQTVWLNPLFTKDLLLHVSVSAKWQFKAMFLVFLEKFCTYCPWTGCFCIFNKTIRVRASAVDQEESHNLHQTVSVTCETMVRLRLKGIKGENMTNEKRRSRGVDLVSLSTIIQIKSSKCSVFTTQRRNACEKKWNKENLIIFAPQS